MNLLAYKFLKRPKIILAGFAAVALICLALIPGVKTNFELADYLPENAPSTVAIKVMEESFSEGLPNVSVYIKDVSIAEALSFKAEIAKVPGVTEVLWLDDVIDVCEPLETADAKTVEAWYKDGGALYSVTVAEGWQTDSVNALRDMVKNRGALAGEAVNYSDVRRTLTSEMPKIILFVVPLGFAILLLSTSSWLEPVLFLATIGIAIVINEGTNIFLGEVSFITRATSAVLQLAISMDYAVFLLHSFGRIRKEEPDLRRAMAAAMNESFMCIAASAATTVLGFLVLTLMRFKIGADMGIVLAKGVTVSFLCVIGLLPVLVLVTSRAIDSTRHRPFLPSFERFGKVVVRFCAPFALAAVLLVVPGYLAQKSNEFVYGTSGMHGEDSIVKKEESEIKAVFGESVQMVLLVPAGRMADEAALSDALARLPEVSSVVSYANTVGVQVPPEYLSKGQLKQFSSGGYDRIILYVNTPDEGQEAFSAVEKIRAVSAEHFGDEYYLVGQSAVNHDLMDTITADNRTVNVAAIAAIGFVILVSFKSLSIPLLLLFTIESAIWINLAVPYFAGQRLNYIGYQIISAVQLGATVDYGILFAQNYLRSRKTLGKKDALRQTVSGTAGSILTPALILTVAGLMLSVISSNGIISQFGAILGRGAVISAGMVLLALPALLWVFDGLIMVTTWRPFGKNRGDL